jgi:hypothetical protein
MRFWFRHAPSTQAAPAPLSAAAVTHPSDTVGESVRALAARVSALEGHEAARAAEHAAQCDQLARLLKRFSQRIVRESEDTTTHAEESVMAMRTRLRR